MFSPLAAWGLYSFRSGRRYKLQAIQDRMLRTFRREITSSYKLSQKDPPGKFRLLEFCAEAEVDAATGKLFLQGRVAEFGGIVDVDKFGDIAYYFGDTKVKFIEENS